MATKATHKGECQICGSTQKLPDGRLSLHGYTTRWGFFSGTCSGARELPWELDSSLVAGGILSAQAQRDSMAKRVAELKADRNPAKVFVKWYSRHDYKYKTAWVDTDTIVEADRGYMSSWVAPVTVEAGTRGGRNRYREEAIATLGPRNGSTAMEAAYKANVQHADAIEKRDITSVDRYIEWQTVRLANWTVRPLRPV
jgi:hypothetical protein